MTYYEHKERERKGRWRKKRERTRGRERVPRFLSKPTTVINDY